MSVELSKTTNDYEGAALPLVHADYPHNPGDPYDCPACEAECFCSRILGTMDYTKCVFCALLEEEA